MNLGISFAPLVPDYVVWSALAVAVALTILLIASRSRGALMRAGAMALFVLALANPSFTREDRDPLTSVAIVVYCTARGLSLEAFYGLCFFLGFGLGYWAVFVTIASEQFGTNLRATVTTTVPNFVRGALVPLIAIYKSLRATMPMPEAALLVGAGCVGLAAVSLWFMQETHGRDLDFTE